MLLDPGSLGDYGHEIEQVSSFKYLGLAHTGDKCLHQCSPVPCTDLDYLVFVNIC